MNQVVNWISGLGSLMAGAGALGVLLWERARAKKGDQEKRDREERDQASRVTWWLEAAPDDDNRDDVRDFADAAAFFGGDYPDLEHVVIVIRNGSDNCLYEGSLQLPETFDSGSSSEEPFLWRQLGVLPPATSRFPIPVTQYPTPTSSLRKKGDLAFNRHVEWIEFRDRNNLLWRRFWDGRLEKQPNRQPNTTTAHSP